MFSSESESFNDVGLLIHDDELERLSLYGTIRPSYLKYMLLDRRTDRGFGSLRQLDRKDDVSDIFQKDQQNDDQTSGDSKYTQELIVKGFDVDSRILPGFFYTVRYGGTREFIYDGEARLLESIGLGYGKRLTFKGDRLNKNEYFFWSDSDPRGYVFNIVAVKVDDALIIYDSESRAVGEVVVTSVDHPQTELETIISNGNILKRVMVRMAVAVKYYHHHSRQLINIVGSEDFQVVEGIAEVEKDKDSRVANLKCIKDIHLQRIGQCSLHREP